MALLASFSLTSCLDDVKDNPITYPAEGVKKTGIWKAPHTQGNYDYTAVRTFNAAGKPIFYVLETGKEGTEEAGVTRMIFLGDSITDNAAQGMMTANSESTFYGDGENGTDVLPGEAYLAYQRNLQSYTMQVTTYQMLDAEKIDTTSVLAYKDANGQWALKEYSREVTCTAEEQAGFPANLAGYWGSGNYEEDPANSTLISLSDSIALLGDGDAQQVEIVYDAAAGTLKITGLDDGQTIEVAFNEQMQLVGTWNGNPIILDPIMDSDSEPEIFVPFYNGTFTDNAILYDGVYKFDVVIYQSEKKASRYCAKPFYSSEDGLIFEITNEQNEEGTGAVIEVTPSSTGLTDPKYGTIWAKAAADYDSGMGAKCYYDGESMAYLNLVYYVPAGYFGYGVETLKFTSPYTGIPRKIAVNSAGKISEIKNLQATTSTAFKQKLERL